MWWLVTCLPQLILLRIHEWLPSILPPQDQEDSVLRDSGMITPPPRPRRPPMLQDPTGITSPPASPPPPASAISSPLRRLLDETADLIESPIFAHVLTLLLDSIFSQLADKKLRSEAFKLPPLTSDLLTSERISEVTADDLATAFVKLPIVLAVMVKEAHNIGRGVPNEYVQAMESVTELDTFAAVIYSSNFECESGFGASVSPAFTGPGNNNDTGAKEQTLENLSGAEADKAVRLEKGAGILDRATGVLDAAWGGFENVWGRVTASGGSVITG